MQQQQKKRLQICQAEPQYSLEGNVFVYKERMGNHPPFARAAVRIAALPRDARAKRSCPAAPRALPALRTCGGCPAARGRGGGRAGTPPASPRAPRCRGPGPPRHRAKAAAPPSAPRCSVPPRPGDRQHLPALCLCRCPTGEQATEPAEKRLLLSEEVNPSAAFLREGTFSATLPLLGTVAPGSQGRAELACTQGGPHLPLPHMSLTWPQLGSTEEFERLTRTSTVGTTK